MLTLSPSQLFPTKQTNKNIIHLRFVQYFLNSYGWFEIGTKIIIIYASISFEVAMCAGKK